MTRPQHDTTTTYLSKWAEEILFLAEQKGISVIDLVRNNANRKELESRINKLCPKLIFFNGHGDDNCVTGHDNEILVKAEDNHKILKDKITYALSCNSGKILGKKVSEDKGTTYIGYSDDFIFICDNSYVTRPLDDPKAKPFMKSSNQIMVSLLKGHSAQEASERSKKIFKKYSNKLSSSDADPDSLQAAQFLWWNMRNQVCLGNGQAKLKKY